MSVSPQVIEFVIPGHCVPRPRPRVRFAAGARSYYPKPYEAWRERAYFIAHISADDIWEGAVTVTARFYHKGKGDLDNLMGSILDAITGTIIKDDSQVAALHGYKIHDADERTEVRVELKEASND